MTAEELIRSKGLKSTPQRVAVISGLMQSGRPLTEHEIKEGMGEGYDRVTFYRTMKTLQESGIIHSILQDEQTMVYALSMNHGHRHAHFVCDSCHKTICLEDDPQISASLPMGFRLRHSDIVIHGLCDECDRAQTGQSE